MAASDMVVGIAALTGPGKQRLTATRHTGAMFMQLHYWGLSRTALILSAIGAMLLAGLAGAGPI